MKLSEKQFKKVSEFINKNARELDKRFFDHHFNNGSSDKVINALVSFQNEDGGFGHGLESDFRAPTSSNLATTIALQYMQYINIGNDIKILNKALDFFSNNFSEQNNRWRPVPDDVNEYPHAPWWHLDEKTNLCAIEKNWANPTVEIIGYLLKYPNKFSKNRLKTLTDEAIKYLSTIKDKNSEHSLFCYQLLYCNAPNEVGSKIYEKLCELIKITVNQNIDDWKEKYVAKPLDFVDAPDSRFYDLFPDLIDKNLNFLIEVLDNNEAWYPVWTWDQYKQDRQKAKIEWAGKKSVENLVTLKRFSRIEE